MTIGDQHVDEAKTMYQRRIDKAEEHVGKLTEKFLEYAGNSEKESGIASKVRESNLEYQVNKRDIAIEQEGKMFAMAYERRMTAMGLPSSGLNSIKQQEREAKEVLKKLGYEIKQKKK